MRQRHSFLFIFVIIIGTMSLAACGPSSRQRVQNQRATEASIATLQSEIIGITLGTTEDLLAMQCEFGLGQSASLCASYVDWVATNHSMDMVSCASGNIEAMFELDLFNTHTDFTDCLRDAGLGINDYILDAAGN